MNPPAWPLALASGAKFFFVFEKVHSALFSGPDEVDSATNPSQDPWPPFPAFRSLPSLCSSLSCVARALRNSCTALSVTRFAALHLTVSAHFNCSLALRFTATTTTTAFSFRAVFSRPDTAR